MRERHATSVAVGDTDLCRCVRTHLSRRGPGSSSADTPSPHCFARILGEDVVLLAEVEGQLVGYVQFGAANCAAQALSLHDGDQALRRLYVHPEFQNRGIGTSLLEAALRHPR